MNATYAMLDQAERIGRYHAHLMKTGIACDMNTAAKTWIAKYAAIYRAKLNAGKIGPKPEPAAYAINN